MPLKVGLIFFSDRSFKGFEPRSWHGQVKTLELKDKHTWDDNKTPLRESWSSTGAPKPWYEVHGYVLEHGRIWEYIARSIWNPFQTGSHVSSTTKKNKARTELSNWSMGLLPRGRVIHFSLSRKATLLDPFLRKIKGDWSIFFNGSLTITSLTCQDKRNNFENKQRPVTKIEHFAAKPTLIMQWRPQMH